MTDESHGNRSVTCRIVKLLNVQRPESKMRLVILHRSKTYI